MIDKFRYFVISGVVYENNGQFKKKWIKSKLKSWHRCPLYVLLFLSIEGLGNK